jgi:lipid-A-disaccharide synthase-like uncharacterized protein
MWVAIAAITLLAGVATAQPASPSGVLAPSAEALQQQVAQQQKRIQELEAALAAGTASPAAPDAGPLWERFMGKLSRLLPATVVGWIWFIVGFVGEFVFFLRFVVQWWASERARKTVVPIMFWHLSLAGTALVLAYAVARIDPVFILAYSLNVFLYVRNLVIARREPALAAVMEKESE